MLSILQSPFLLNINIEVNLLCVTVLLIIYILTPCLDYGELIIYWLMVYKLRFYTTEILMCEVL